MKNEGLQRVVASKLFPPAFMFIAGLLLILFGEKLPANDGLGWDGSRYASLARDFLASPVLDEYFIMRMFPSALVHVFLNVFSLPMSNPNIIIGFELIDLLSITLSVFVIKLIFDHLQIEIKKQLLGFSLFIISYSILVYSFYYPVMTDPFALLLSTLLLYFYLLDRPLNIALVGFIGGFTFPVLLYQAFIMILFPVSKEKKYEPFSKKTSTLLSILSSLYIFLVILYYVIEKNADTDFAFSLHISKPLLPLSIAYVLGLYFFFSKILYNKYLLSASYLTKYLHMNRILFALIFFACYYGIKQEVYPEMKPSPYYSAENFLKVFLVEGLARPLITIVSDTTYFGAIIILLIIFWKRFCNTISMYGLGLPLAFLLPVYLVGIGSESRMITILFPWMVIFWIKATEQVRFQPAVYYILLGINLVASKIWLPINYDITCGPDASGAIGFPNQKFFMNMGPWMSEQMWLWQLIIFLPLAALTFFAFRKYSDAFSKAQIINPV